VRAAVLGRPINHSLSPTLHRTAYRELGLDWTFEAIDAGADDLAPLLRTRDAQWVGFACTMPLKRVAIRVAADASERAIAVGAANTLLRRPDGGWRADNTDVAGLLAALGEHGVRPTTATVLGAGGTAQAALVALAATGLRRCTVLVRDVARTDEVARTAERAGIDLAVGPFDDDAALDAHVVISALPPGAADALAAHAWEPGQAVVDAVYTPWPTPLAAAVAGAGGTVVSGALMLLHQAAEQVRLMTGRSAPVDAMRAVLRDDAPGI
jgi:shikimate dehydrogenase